MTIARVQESRRIPPTGQQRPCTPHLVSLVSLVLVCLAMLPCTTARLITARSKTTGQVSVMMDLEFTLTVTARQDGVEFASRQFTEIDVDDINLYEVGSGYINFLEMVFRDRDGREKGHLTYRFLRYISPDIVTLIRDFFITPAAMFENIPSSVESMRFTEPGHAPEILGVADKPYLCEATQAVCLMKASTKTDDYDYTVNLETSYFLAQAFNVRNATMSLEAPNVCSPRPDTLTITVVAGVAAGGIFLMTLMAIAAVVFVHLSRRRKHYQPLGEEQNIQLP